MKKTSLLPVIAAIVSASAATATAQTTDFTNASGTDALITNADNWSNGLPTGGTAGTIDLDPEVDPGAGYATEATLVGYDITHTSGTLHRVSGLNSLPIGEGTTYRMNGADADFGSTRGISVNGIGASFILDGGNADASNNSRDSAVANTGAITVNGGTLSIGRHLFLQEGSITVNGGTLTVPSDLGSRNFHTGGDLTFNGGIVTAKNLTFGTGGLDLTLGGATAGTLTIENFAGARHNASAIGIDFLAGSLMSMQLTAPLESGDSGDGDIGWMEVGGETGEEWAEALWADGRLTFNGDNFEVLGDWTTVSVSVFVYDSVTNTLSLAGGGPSPQPLKIVSFEPVSDQPGVLEVKITGTAGADYIFRSAADLDFSSGVVVESLAPGIPAVGTIAGTNNSVLTTDAGGQATVRMILTGDPADFIRAEDAP